MSQIEFEYLIDLLDKYPEQIENIIDQYLLLLSELTTTEYIKTGLFLKNVKKIHEMGAIVVAILKDISNNSFEIIGSGTIIIEPKIIRGGRNVGHIEDIVVAKHMRGKGISSNILYNLNAIAREMNCYKVILDCDESLKKFYIKNGYTVKGVQMAEYFN